MYSYCYLLHEMKQFCPPTSMQLLSTNKTSDDNSPAMSVDGPRLNKYRDQTDELRGSRSGRAYSSGRTFDLANHWTSICACAVTHPLCTYMRIHVHVLYLHVDL